MGQRVAIGWAVGLKEAISGQDHWTGQRLSWWGRALSLIGTASMFIGAALAIEAAIADSRTASMLQAATAETAAVARGGSAPVRLGQAGEQTVRGIADIGPKHSTLRAGRAFPMA